MDTDIAMTACSLFHVSVLTWPEAEFDCSAEQYQPGKASVAVPGDSAGLQ